MDGATRLASPASLTQDVPSISRLTTFQFMDSMFLDPEDECLAANIEVTCRVDLVPIPRVQGSQDELFFDCFQTNALRRAQFHAKACSSPENCGSNVIGALAILDFEC